MTGAAPRGRSPGAGRAAVFRAARRHSRLVRSLRVLLPLSACGLALFLIVSAVFDPRAMLADKLDAKSLGLVGSRIVMERPKLSGFGENSKSYEVTAERAEQDVAQPHFVDLFGLRAVMQTQQNGWAELLASNGRMNNKEQTLVLSKSIRISTDLGDKAALSNAAINLATGDIVSKEPVSITLGRAHLTANSMQLFQNGDRAIFEGRVLMIIQPETTPGADPGKEALR